MDPTVLKITAAGILHDIGKFMDDSILDIPKEYVRDHADLYQPFYQGRHTHIHAVYTAAFIEFMKDWLPPEFQDPSWGEGDPLVNLAAAHHRPETPMQWIIAMADRISSGLDRLRYEQLSQRTSWKDYKKVRLLPLFESIRIQGQKDEVGKEEFSYALPLRRATAEDIFPGKRTEIEPSDTSQAEEEYRKLGEDFVDALKGLCHREISCALWLEHFESLLMEYASSIPSDRSGDILPDVSLFDHSKTTAALAAALFLYHQQTHSLNVRAVQDEAEKKFLLINGDFYGIQEFIFGGYGEARRYRSKLLRGRSFAVTMLSELAAALMCQKLGLHFISVVLNAAGKFTLLAPNTKSARERLQEVEEEINRWLMRFFLGQNTVGISVVEAAPRDFISGNFPDLWERATKALIEKKSTRIDLDKYGGPIHGYLDGFDNTLTPPLCPLCGKRPSDKEASMSDYVHDLGSACKICRDHIYLGTNVVKNRYVAVLWSQNGGSARGEGRLLEPLLGTYQVIFPKGDLEKETQERRLFKHWDLWGGMEEQGDLGVTRKWHRGYVPLYEKRHLADERFRKTVSAESLQHREGEIRIGDPMTLNHISVSALRPKEEGGGWQGTDALGILKADVDHLGLILACGLPPERLTLSRLSTLSRQLNQFFSLYLPDLLEKSFGEVYTVFAGGDDLFLIGPWNTIMELALCIHDSFSRYVCMNPEVHLSAGITLHRPHTPLDRLAQAVNTSLESSKRGGRDRITVFGETATWEEFQRLREVGHRLEEWLDSHIITKGMVYRLLDLIEMAAREGRIVRADRINLEEMVCTKWRSYLAYSCERNVARRLREDRKEEVVSQVAGLLGTWIHEYRGKLKIPLWQILYDRR